MANFTKVMSILLEAVDFHCKNCGENLGKATQLGKKVHCSTCGKGDQKNPAGDDEDDDSDYDFVSKKFKVGDKVEYSLGGHKDKKTGKITKIDHDGFIHVDSSSEVALSWQSVKKI